jgi:hypothetical protein
MMARTETKQEPIRLAEALLLRADLQKKQASLRSRIENNAAVQQGDKPHEDPTKLMAEFNGVTEELAALVYRINVANLRGTLADGRSITQALAQRDALVQRHAMLTAAAGAANKQPDRYGIREIKWVTAVPVASLQKQADDLARQVRETNVAIQEANWRVLLSE